VVSIAPAGSKVLQVLSSFLGRTAASRRARQWNQALSCDGTIAPKHFSNFSPTHAADASTRTVGLDYLRSAISSRYAVTAISDVDFVAQDEEISF
jgi:hypothetical protein